SSFFVASAFAASAAFASCAARASGAVARAPDETSATQSESVAMRRWICIWVSRGPRRGASREDPTSGAVRPSLASPSRRVRLASAGRPACSPARSPSRAATRGCAMILLLDNYDSFTFNLCQAIAALGAEVEVHRNDALTVDQVLARGPAAV